MVVPYLLWPDRRYTFVSGSSPLAPSAQFAYSEVEYSVLLDVPAQRIVKREHFVLIGRYVRPRPCADRPPHETPCPPGGDAVLLYERPGLPGTTSR